MCPVGLESTANGLRDRCDTDERNTDVSPISVSPKPILEIFTRCSTFFMYGINDGKCSSSISGGMLQYRSVVAMLVCPISSLISGIIAIRLKSPDAAVSVAQAVHRSFIKSTHHIINKKRRYLAGLNATYHVDGR